MFDPYGHYQASSVAASMRERHYDPCKRAIGKAVSVFWSLRWRAQLRRVWGMLMRRPYRLLDLDDVRRTAAIEAMHEAGCRTIEVKRIRGSESRVCDFDNTFLPMSDSNAQRWAGIYAARMSGQSMPAISVVQVGDSYYVRDGHHRVSISRLMGEEYIEAHVLVWQIKDQPAAAPAMSMQMLAMF